MTTLKKPDMTDPIVREKLAKGMGHNYYGEPAWPNDLLYMFPVVIMGTFALIVGLSVLDPALVGEPADPFGLFTVPFLENVNKFQNPFRRPLAMAVFLFGTAVTLYLGAGALFPVDKALTLGLF